MLAWRVTRQAHAAQPLSGEGARLFGGRWNHAGTPVVYTSASLSLAVLEYLVNLSISDLPDDLVSIEIKIADNLPRLETFINDLPKNWRAFPAVEELKDIGTDWGGEEDQPLLVVPSVVIPHESNYLINPAHPLINRIEIIAVETFALDSRLSHIRKPARKGSRKATR